MSSPFRIGIVGTGAITGSSHLPAALASPLIEVTALVDPVVERARELARDYGLKARVAPSVKDVFDAVDGLVIATPNHTHKDLAIQCVEAGVHCIVEKPLATTSEDAQAVADAANSSGITVAVGYSTLFHDEVVILHDMLRAGFFGRVKSFLYQSGSVGGWAPMSGYNLDRKLTGGGVLVVTGAHFIDKMLYWFGFPDEVALEDDSTGGPEAHCVVTCRFKREDHEFVGTVRLSKTTKLMPGLAIDTERGMVILPTRHPAPLLLRPVDQPEIQLSLIDRKGPIFEPGKNVFQLQLENFASAARGERAAMCDAGRGVESVRLVEQLYANRSLIEDTWHLRNESNNKEKVTV